MFKKNLLSVIYAVAFLLTLSSVAFSYAAVDYNNINRQPFKDAPYEPAQYETTQYKYDAQHPAQSFRNLIDSLDNIGVLNIVKILVGESFDSLVDTVETGFHKASEGQHATDINIILTHFRDNWSRAINKMKSVKKANSEVDIKSFAEFMNTYQDLLDQSIRSDGRLLNSDVVPFLGQLHVFFVAVEAAYSNLFQALKGFGLPIKIDWNIFSLTNHVVANISDEVVDIGLIKELVRTPGALFNDMAQLLDNVNEMVGNNPMAPLFIQFAESAVTKLVEHLKTISNQKEHSFNRGAEL